MSGQREKRDRFVSNISIIYVYVCVFGCVCNIRNKKCCKPCDPFIIPVLHPALCASIVTFTWFILLSLSCYTSTCLHFVQQFKPSNGTFKWRALRLCLWEYTSVTQREDADDNPALLSTQTNPTSSSFLFLPSPLCPDLVTAARGAAVYSKDSVKGSSQKQEKAWWDSSTDKKCFKEHSQHGAPGIDIQKTCIPLRVHITHLIFIAPPTVTPPPKFSLDIS